MDNSNQTPIPPPLPPKHMSDRKLRTYKILLAAAILGLLICVAALSAVVKKQTKQPMQNEKRLKTQQAFIATPTPKHELSHDKLIFVFQDNKTRLVYGNVLPTLFTPNEITLLRDRIVNPFIDYYHEKGEKYITVMIEKETAKPSEYQLIGITNNNGVQGQLINKNNSVVDFWFPTCMGDCPFSAAYKTKYPEVVKLGAPYAENSNLSIPSSSASGVHK